VQLEVVKISTQHKTWAKAHDERLEKIENSLVMTNNALQAVASKVAIVDGQGLMRDKRISTEAERVDKIEARLRRQEDTGVHNIGQLRGAEKAREAMRKGFLFAFAVLGAMGVAGGIIFGALKLAGCGG
jgi:uncharacterized protein (DUF3084 family)